MGCFGPLSWSVKVCCALFCFFFNDTATTEIYTLSLHDALPISPADCGWPASTSCPRGSGCAAADRKSTRLNSSHLVISYAVFCLKKKNIDILRLGLSSCDVYCFYSVAFVTISTARLCETLAAAFFFLELRHTANSTLFPYTTLFR